MELLDIVDQNGEPTGVVKERTKIHEEGDLHRTAHVWVVRENEKSGLDVLLQKRSETKDAFPGCYDTSSAGHIPAGCGYVESALRELKEELGIEAKPEELEERGLIRLSHHEVFHGKVFKNNQVSRIYRLKRNDLKLEDLQLQKEELDSVIWMDYKECLEAIQNHRIKNCITVEELEKII